MLCAQAAGGQAEQALPTAVAVELIHNFSLLHDDVMDGDVTRRHRRTVWSEFGTADAILLGDALMVLAFKYAAGLSRTTSVRLTEILLDMLHGQKLDMSFSDRSDITIDEGLAMAAGKQEPSSGAPAGSVRSAPVPTTAGACSSGSSETTSG